ncbi:hypothetical protein AAFF_G00163700 [Aldrovandia affinis]|uniref:Uncharacterized protein n=1 Tax=Aldrovandia affinis TaxID=143900 RepID=A0AAD7T0J5_9TELE|nr:hypothetical protein AAFF_G00163700 [Aldrovandia affinis]
MLTQGLTSGCRFFPVFNPHASPDQRGSSLKVRVRTRGIVKRLPGADINVINISSDGSAGFAGSLEAISRSPRFGTLQRRPAAPFARVSVF